MTGRAKRGFWTDDSYWVQYWAEIPDCPETEDEPRSDHTGELILALAALTEKQRFVIECLYGLSPGGNDLPTCEVARLMGVSHQAVTRLHHRALRALERGLRNSPISA